MTIFIDSRYDYMKILCIADEESKMLWDYFKKEYFEDIDLIVSCGDLNSSYLSFLTTLTNIPVLYIHGNHDDKYEQKPPEGCICIEDSIYVYKGVRFLGLGGCMRYNRGINQYSEKQMKNRVRKLAFQLLKHKGFDVLVTHAPAKGLNDSNDLCHQGFETFNYLLTRYKPKYYIHGHVHLNYGRQFKREDHFEETTVINAFEKYILEIPDV